MVALPICPRDVPGCGARYVRGQWSMMVSFNFLLKSYGKGNMSLLVRMVFCLFLFLLLLVVVHVGRGQVQSLCSKM